MGRGLGCWLFWGCWCWVNTHEYIYSGWGPGFRRVIWKLIWNGLKLRLEDRSKRCCGMLSGCLYISNSVQSL
ncbi:hypothetical protein BDV29DRAFT_173962, partial [Aspergillus leporis]